MRTAGTHVDLATLNESDHCCITFDDFDEFSTRAISFLTSGIELGLQGAFVSRAPAEVIESQLRQQEVASRFLDNGSMRVWSISDTYSDGFPEPHTQVEAYAAATRESIARGFRGLRIAADATSLIDTPERASIFARYEHLVDRFMTSHPFSAMCGYRITEGLAQEAVTQVAAMHPVAIGTKTPLRLFVIAHHTYGLVGEIDFWSASLLESTLDRADPAGETGQIVLDLSGIEFMDHHGVKALAEYAERRGAHMMLTKTPEHVGKLVDILDVTRLTVVDS